MSAAAAGLAPPSKVLLLLEGGRSLFEFGLLGPSLPLLRGAARGDGHPVLVLPGLGADDLSTLPLRRFLSRHGYAAQGWQLGRNLGRPALLDRLQERLDQLHRQHGRGVSLVGWSLGGIYAREAAKRMPQQVRCVVTLGSPFRGPGRASNVQRVYEFLSGEKSRDGDSLGLERTPPVPTTAIFTRGDGIVPWQRCIEAPGRERVESIEVRGSHCGLGHNPSVLYAVSDRLAQLEGAWTPFQPHRALRLLYPDPWRGAA